ncbi:hypothetical protein [Paractinoplanes toevensis]|uniref:ABC transporter permease n=1 Tax=Paractinoplanes toevensis TaxID=571911 RepID=A0A919W840_9ACTN|nr:hypothetical protein [Actinoplanes toevensis]GIM91866.1 hypothetical protein Ato02nite_036590 [Actinoplanes toevensis]
MTRTLARTATAELIKLGGLPAARGAVAGTVAAGALLAAALASSAPAGPDAGRVVTQAVPLLQAGPILIGILTAASEYAGRQIATTLAATPNRLRLLAGKAVAYLLVAAATSVATIGAGLAAAWLTRAVRGDGPARELDGWAAAGGGWAAAGAVVYLVLIGLLALGLAVLLRSLVPSLAGMLALVLVVSPLLSGFTEHARWLPDRAGSLLYRPGADPVLGPATGAAVLLIWTALITSVAAAAFHSRDA